MAQHELSLSLVMETMLRLIDSIRKADNDKARREEDYRQRREQKQLAVRTIDKVPPMTEKDDIELYIQEIENEMCQALLAVKQLGVGKRL